MNLKHVKEICKYAKSLGLTCEQDGKQSKHIRLRLRKGEASMLLIVSASPSCHHADANNRTLVRKFAQAEPVNGRMHKGEA